LRWKGMASELVGKRTARLLNCDWRVKGDVLKLRLANPALCMNGDVWNCGLTFIIIVWERPGCIIIAFGCIIIVLEDPPRIRFWALIDPADTASAAAVTRDNSVNLMMCLLRVGEQDERREVDSRLYRRERPPLTRSAVGHERGTAAALLVTERARCHSGLLAFTLRWLAAVGAAPVT
jgi:hypothetical protein